MATLPYNNSKKITLNLNPIKDLVRKYVIAL